MLTLLLLIVVVCAGIITLCLSPYLDQFLALLPYNYHTHYFYGELATWCKVIYYSVNLITVLLIIMPLARLILHRQGLIGGNWQAIKRMLIVTYLTLILGPGLLVNTFFKDEWGRARPYQVIRDHQPFSYPWQPHFNRPKNNSFPSGHVAIGAMLGIPFIAARRKKIGIVLCLSGASGVGIVRYLQGGHYFSDIVIAALLVWLVAILVMQTVDRYLVTS